MFLTDVMLTKLGRWLRIMGIESVSPASDEIDDDVIIYRALKERRILLTMDKEMSQNAIATGAKVILLPSTMTDVEDQLVHVITSAGIDLDSLKGRMLCTECGAVVHETDSGGVKDLVPEGILSTTDSFWKCDSCNHVYWEGSHWRNIQKTVSKVKACVSQ